jgi:antitoxin CcdA
VNAPTKPVARRATNVSLDQQVVAEARMLGVNLSRACEEGLRAEVKKARDAQWLEENREAIESSNAWVEKHGLPLGRFRLF